MTRSLLRAFALDRLSKSCDWRTTITTGSPRSSSFRPACYPAARVSESLSASLPQTLDYMPLEPSFNPISLWSCKNGSGKLCSMPPVPYQCWTGDAAIMGVTTRPSWSCFRRAKALMAFVGSSRALKTEVAANSSVRMLFEHRSFLLARPARPQALRVAPVRCSERHLVLGLPLTPSFLPVHTTRIITILSQAHFIPALFAYDSFSRLIGVTYRIIEIHRRSYVS